MNNDYKVIKNNFKLPKTILAPMAGITDVVLRSIVRSYSPSTLLTTEMISAEALCNKPDVKISEVVEKEAPIFCQLVGHKIDKMAKAAKILAPKCQGIDINMGCPVKKVTSGGDGSALMLTPSLAYDIVQAVTEAVEVPVSVKFRLGFTKEQENFIELGQLLEKAGADFITLHGRYRSQMYSGSSNWEKIGELVKNVSIPIFANGDILSCEDSQKCLITTKAYGISIGRGILYDTSLLSRIEHNDKQVMSFQNKIKVLKDYIKKECDYRGEKVAIKFMRKFYPFFINNLKNASKYRLALMTEETLDGVNKIIDDILSHYLLEV